jgi:hypothetical protein
MKGEIPNTIQISFFVPLCEPLPSPKRGGKMAG